MAKEWSIILDIHKNTLVQLKKLSNPDVDASENKLFFLR